jgi:hypothetical protein
MYIPLSLSVGSHPVHMFDYSILPVMVSDVDDIPTCADRAYANNAFAQATFPDNCRHMTPPEDLYAWKLSDIRARLDAQGAGYIEAVFADSPNRIIGFAGHYQPDHFASQPSESVMHPSPSTPTQQHIKAPACMDVVVRASFREHLDRQRHGIWGADMQFCTSPS